MSDENDSYFASGKKIRLIRSKDTFALELQTFFGKNTKGKWALNAADHVRRDTGKLNLWRIEITLGE